MNLFKIRIEQCKAARGIEDDFGTPKAVFLCTGNYYRSRFAEVLSSGSGADPG
jgi:hypothetical protein